MSQPITYNSEAPFYPASLFGIEARTVVGWILLADGLSPFEQVTRQAYEKVAEKAAEEFGREDLRIVALRAVPAEGPE